MEDYHKEAIEELIWDIRHEYVREDLDGLKSRLIRLGKFLSKKRVDIDDVQ